MANPIRAPHASAQSPARKRRALSPRGATAVLVVVVVAAGGIGYGVLDVFAPTGKGAASSVGCVPSTLYVCTPSNAVNDVILFVDDQPSSGQPWASVLEGQSLTATTYLSGSSGETASDYTVTWGDGTHTTLPSPTFIRSYSGLGLYVINASANVSGVVHTGTRSLFPISVEPTSGSVASGKFPVLVTSLSNGSSAWPQYPWVHAGGHVTVSARYSTLPTAPGYSALPPSVVASRGATLVSLSNNSTTLSATVSFETPGTYQVTMVGPIAVPGGKIYQNYTWSVYVGAAGVPLGCMFCRSGGASGTLGTSPHPGSIYAYEAVLGGPTTLDPAVDYETVGGEIIQNVFETLVQYDGSSTANFVPVLSTCVPGPAATGPTSCQSQYGSDLNGPLSGTGPNGTYWTFPIDPNASFYDPSTGVHWGVYPSDVMFSVARTLLWLETPNEYATSGWILGQSLLPFGNKSWDGALHTPWNNTPQEILGSMLVNDSAYCPPRAMAMHGCITFVADGSGQPWPEFLQFVADEEGSSVVPCGWYTFMGAGLPGFVTNATNGDGPCLLPGGVSSTNTPTFRNYLSSVNPRLYDPIIELSTEYYPPPGPYPAVRYDIVGSGPYWLESVDQGQGYVLQANPWYAQPNCAGQPNCYPGPGDYARNVYVFWDSTSVTGLDQYMAGQSDTSEFFPSNLPEVLAMENESKVGLYQGLTFDIATEAFTAHFIPAQTQSASGLTTNIPGDFFSYVGMREFLSQAFPFFTYLNVDSSLDGIPLAQGLGGVLPQGFGNYDPTNISWPGLNQTTNQWHDPDTNSSVVGSAAWWWANITDPKSPYYDPEAVTCKTTTCHFPLAVEVGSTALDSAIDAWSSMLHTITNGALAPSRWDYGFGGYIVVCPSCAPPGEGPLDTFLAWWTADYPDPTDLVSPFYAPDQYWAEASAWNETFVGDQFGGTYDGCSANAGAGFANLAYWANVRPIIPQSCQGTAYEVLTWAIGQAALIPVGPERVLYYNLIEHIANALAMYTGGEQLLSLGSYAPWIDPTTIDTNPMAPGQLWFFWDGTGVVN